MRIGQGLNGFSGLLIGILIAGNGVVEVQRDNVWVGLKPGEEVNTGNRVRTGAFSSASLELEPGKVVTLDQGTQIQLRESNGSPLVQLESGDMRVLSATDIQVAAKDTLLQSVERPLDMLDMQVELQADRVNLMVFSGAVRNGAVTIRGAEDSSVRTYVAGGRSLHHDYSATYPSFFIYPYMCGNAENGGNAGNAENRGTVPPHVSNPTNPSYRPDQVVPPMSDPIRPPVQIRPNR